jgi:hypothetical protein
MLTLGGLMGSPFFGAKAFFALGLAFLLASLIRSHEGLPSVGINVHATYFVVSHFHLLQISALICWLFAGAYYLGHQLCGLGFNLPLVVTHVVATTLGLVGLNSVTYLVVSKQEDGSAQHLFARLGFLGVGLFLAGTLVFLAVFLVAVIARLRRVSA